MSAGWAIRPAGRGDLDVAVAVIGAAFGSAPHQLGVYAGVHASPSGTLLVAEEGGELLGAAAALSFGASGWLGGIAVRPGARGRGLGTALTRAAIDALGPGAHTVSLFATHAGRGIYERLGFAAEGAYLAFWGRPDAVPDVRGTRRLTPQDAPALVALDRAQTGEDRTAGLILAGADGDVVDGRGGALRGALLRTAWGSRPIVATDPEAGERLLRAAAAPSARIVVPEANAAALAHLRGHGWTPGDGVERMRLGAPLAWRPEGIWGVSGLFWG